MMLALTMDQPGQGNKLVMSWVEEDTFLVWGRPQELL